MEFFLVGGAVRDQLLGLSSQDRDYVVVGATHDDMIYAGFTKVGADFPVYLKDGEEYALARQERKIGSGYKGFETSFGTDVTLEEDLHRRDLTINAMAVDGHGQLIDPFGGKKDLENGVLRHVSEAFAEDPLRVLRVARFAARFNFTVATKTMNLMRDLCNTREMEHLTPERVWKEFSRAMCEPHPSHFFWVLQQCGAIHTLFPELDRSIIHVGRALSRAALRELPLVERCMLLFSQLDAGTIERVLERMKAPHEIITMSTRFSIVLEHIYEAVEYPEIAFDVLKRVNAFRNADQFFRIAQVMLYLGGNEMIAMTDKLLEAFQAARRISFASLSIEQQQTLEGKEIGQAINELAFLKIQEVIES